MARRAPNAVALWVAAITLLAATLIGLAVLQYRWIGELSRAETQRIVAAARQAADQIGRDFDGELDRAIRTFRIPPDDQPIYPLHRRFEEWNQTAIDSQIIRRVYVAELSPDTPTQLQRYDQQSSTLTPLDVPNDFEPLLQRARTAQRGTDFVFDTTHPMLAIHIRPRPEDPMRGPIYRWVLLELDRARLIDRFVPLLIDRHLGDKAPFQVLLFDESGKIVHRQGEMGRSAETPAAAPLFALRNLQMAMGPPRDSMRPRPPMEQMSPGAPPDRGRPPLGRAEMGPPPDGRPRFDGPPPNSEEPLPPPAGDEKEWRLEIHRVAGATDPIDTARKRNLSVSALILLVLIGAVALVVLLARRSHSVAKQQLALVAGVTHELNTPVASIFSAGQNLADGIVHEPEQVRRYGSIIAREGKRLSAMIEQVLGLAAIESRSIARKPIALAATLERAIALAAADIESHQATVEKKIDPTLVVNGEMESLVQLFRNLISNAAKYGGKNRWIGITAARRDSVAEISVRDRGEGISPSDLPHVFDPFFRGRHTASSVHGSGLGLAIAKRVVDQHGGTIKVSSDRNGTVVTVELPLEAA